MIRQVMGEASSSPSPPIQTPNYTPSLEDHLKLNVSTKTNIVNIFAFNIYPAGKGSEEYEVKDFNPVKTTIKTEADVHLQPPGQYSSHIESHYQYESMPTTEKRNKMDTILGAVLLAQLEGGGSDRVIQALGRNPAMMAALMNSAPASSQQPSRGSSTSGLYPNGVDPYQEYAPGPYGTIARNKLLEKMILAMKQDIGTGSGVRELASYMEMMKGTPEYAKLLLSSGNSRVDQGEPSGLDLLSPVGPLGYRVGDTNESPSIPQQQQQQQKKKNPVEML